MTSLARDTLRFHRPHLQLARPFGSDSFGRVAEVFARAFGTPVFLITQTVLVVLWIVANSVWAAFRWDPYPFILLNLAFSLQAAYAAPLILLAQTRQADRDKALAIADAQQRDDIALGSLARQHAASVQTEELRLLLESNAAAVADVQRLTRELHRHALAGRVDGTAP